MTPAERKDFAAVLKRVRLCASEGERIRLGYEECKILAEGFDALSRAVNATATARDEGNRYRYSSIGFRLLAERSQGEADAAVDKCLDILEQLA